MWDNTRYTLLEQLLDELDYAPYAELELKNLQALRREIINNMNKLKEDEH